MAADDERELDALLSELRATDTPPRDESDERARRARIGRAIERQAQAHGAPRAIAGVRGGRRAAWALGAAAAALLLGVSIATWLRSADTAMVEPELIQSMQSSPAAETRSAIAASAEVAEPLRSSPVTETRPSRRPVAPTAPPRAPSAVPAAASAETPQPKVPEAESSSASLADQNELFQSAVRAARRGDDESALRQFDLLLERFPTSPLAADSLVRKFRTLARLGRMQESAQAAREYLKRYPKGFAATEAEKILSSASSGGQSGTP